ncbi:MAG: ABC transporter substrate-binding protein [Chloroflexi bacterium]|nr:ABC transporter substrate-binding protein [Chloroflexota bacterium]MCY3588316.1 ABC transporter substrate-binding protein [Chloroflexota bacterium]MCY3684865.1 ABC transporter substrate-binding protein [Chloroflexota bacterium]MDE2708695.1 ABC transporter substrate-binding protein [Chloroflexota bacterium]
MSDRNYWQRMKRRQLSRRTLLRASARAGVGATGLALVGCGDDDDDGQQTVAQAQQQDQQQQQAMQQQADQQQQQQAMQQQAQQQQQQQAMQQQQADQQAQAATQQEEVAEEIAEGVGEAEEEWSMPRPLDEVDLDAEIVIAVGSDSGGLDHHRTGSAQNYISHGAVYSGPLDRDPRDNSMYAGLATPEWIDPVTLRLDIIPAKFHDGSTLVAGDMVFSYDRMGGLAEYHQGGETSDHPGGWVPAYPARSALNWVRNEAPDDRTWSIELPAPDAGFLTVNMDGSGEVTIHSQADTEGRGDLALDQEPMGTGPFRFVGHTDDENFIFERFDDHYNPIDYPVRVSHVPHHRRLTGLVRPELQSRLAGLEAGEIDVIHEGVGVNAAKPYIDDPNFTVQFQPGAGWSVHNIYPNLWQETTPDGDPNPFLDIRVRQAANHAINRRAIIDNLFLGVGDMSMLVYSGVPGYPSPEEKAEVVFDYNVEKAKQLMAEAGYEDGFDVPLYYTPDWGGDVVADLVLVASQDLAQIGIRVTPVPTLGSEYFTPQYSSGRDAAPWGLYWFYANAVPDIGSMWECCGGADGFFTISPPQDPRLQELYLAQRVEQDPDRRLEIISELLLEHTRQATFIFIVEPPDTVVTRADVNYPKGGRVGNLNFLMTFAIQRLKT